MKSVIYIICFLTVSQMLYSQDNYTGSNVPYEPCTNCTNNNYSYSGQIDHYDTEQIISDFGPRYISANTPYDFHGGIDYTTTLPNPNPPNDLGYHLVAIEGGNIVRLRNYIRPNGNPYSLQRH